jgi:CRISPR-associated protein Csd2
MSITNPKTRHEFVLLFDVVNGNPNGDPDAGNLPRVDPETMHGLVSDVALKRKVRDYVQNVQRDEVGNPVEGYGIFIQSRVALNALIEQAGDAVGIKQSKTPQDAVRAELCRRYYDIRLFGAVLSTGTLNAGQVRGPIQITFARSLHPIAPLDLSITRKARTTEERMETGETEMGRKPIVPYGLYRSHGFFNPYLAEQTGVSERDLEIFWEAMQNLFEFDRSAARGEMAVRGLFVFTHDNPKGNAPAHKLFELVQVRRLEDGRPPRSFAEYEIVAPPAGSLIAHGFPGVTLTRLI